jgi:hypothetical protein
VTQERIKLVVGSWKGDWREEAEADSRLGHIKVAAMNEKASKGTSLYQTCCMRLFGVHRDTRFMMGFINKPHRKLSE